MLELGNLVKKEWLGKMSGMRRRQLAEVLWWLKTVVSLTFSATNSLTKFYVNTFVAKVPFKILHEFETKFHAKFKIYFFL